MQKEGAVAAEGRARLATGGQLAGRCFGAGEQQPLTLPGQHNNPRVTLLATRREQEEPGVGAVEGEVAAQVKWNGR